MSMQPKREWPRGANIDPNVSPFVRSIYAASAPTEIEQLRREVENLRETIEERMPPPSPLVLGAEMWAEFRRLPR